jgi:glycosyltransferase involved in cell wall biosynthesis
MGSEGDFAVAVAVLPYAVNPLSDKVRRRCRYQSFYSQKRIHKMPIKVSIIIPIYNKEKYLRTCLNSVINQSLKEIEIICINDGSTDDSLKVLNEFAANDNRIVVIDQPNQKASIARNRGLEIARGEFIGFVDADDWIENNYYEALFTQCKKENADMAIALTTTEFFSQKPLRYLNAQRLLFPSLHGLCLDKDFGFGDVWHSLFKASLISQNKIIFPPYRYSEVTEFSLKAQILSKKTIPVINTCYHAKAQIDNALTQTSNQKQKNQDFATTINAVLAFINSINLDTKTYLNVFSTCLLLQEDLVLNSSTSQDQKFFFESAYTLLTECKHAKDFKENLYHPFFSCVSKKNFNAYAKLSKNPKKYKKEVAKFYTSASIYFDKKMTNLVTNDEEIYISAIRILTLIKTYLPIENTILDINQNTHLWQKALDIIRHCAEGVIAGADPQSHPKGRQQSLSLLLSIGQLTSLPEPTSITHIKQLTQTSPLILFSPQNPENVNISSAIKKPPAFWSYQFRQNGFICFDILRQKIWDDPWVSKEYKQDILLYAKESAAQILLTQGLKPIDTPSTLYTQDFIEALTDSGLKKLKKYRKYYQIGFAVSAILLIFTLFLLS